MKKGVFTLIENAELVPGMHRLTFSGDGSGIVPGQFAEVRIPGYFLRRPFSVAGFDNGHLTLAVRVRGEGTAALDALEPGARLDILTCLGNGFDLSLAGERPLLIGGGSGAPALWPLCRELMARGAEVTAALGFNTVYVYLLSRGLRRPRREGGGLYAGRSLGRRGLVTAALEDFGYTSVYACGAVPMLQIIDRDCRTPRSSRSRRAWAAALGPAWAARWRP